MKLEATIRVQDTDVDILKAAFQNEQRTQERSSCTIHKEADAAIFIIKAEDPTALRATLNSITKLLTVYEKVH